MAANHERCNSDVDDDDDDDDYIDIEVSSFANLVRKTHNNNPREFEFQMSHLCPIDKTTSLADELFYKGKLLPLHLPPRLQMVQNLLEDYTFDDEFYNTPLATTPATSNTPFESCNVSPVESCQVSKELNPQDYFLEYSNSIEEEEDEKKKSWTKKLRLMKQLSFGTKIKASKAYLRSFFGKSACSDDSSSVLRYSRVQPFGQMKTDMIDPQNVRTANFSLTNLSLGPGLKTERPKKQSNGHRRSFSVSTRRKLEKNSNPKSSSSGLGFRPLQFLKRSNSSSSEIENSLQGAILYCKQSFQQKQKQCSVTEVGFCSLSASRISVRDDQERAKLFRG